MKTVLVTGGAGYIGSQTIVELLKNGYRVVSIDNFSNSSPKVFEQIFKLTGQKVKNYNIDLCDHNKLEGWLKKEKFEAVMHFAGYKAVKESVENPLKYYTNNLDALLGALILARYKTASFIFSSSATVYDQKIKPPYQEKNILCPNSPYGLSKKIGEDILENYVSNNSSLKALSLRYFNPIGAHPSLLLGENPMGTPNNLVPVITSSVKNKKSFSVFGNDYKTRDGTCLRDYIHVTDVARAHILALKYLEKKQPAFYDVFNIGTGKATSVLEITKSFEKANNLKLNYIFKEKRPGDVPILCANTKKAQQLLKFKPQYTISNMLQTAWEWEKKLPT